MITTYVNPVNPSQGEKKRLANKVGEMNIEQDFYQVHRELFDFLKQRADFENFSTSRRILFCETPGKNLQ